MVATGRQIPKLAVPAAAGPVLAWGPQNLNARGPAKLPLPLQVPAAGPPPRAQCTTDVPTTVLHSLNKVLTGHVLCSVLCERLGTSMINRMLSGCFRSDETRGKRQSKYLPMGRELQRIHTGEGYRAVVSNTTISCQTQQFQLKFEIQFLGSAAHIFRAQ